MRNVTLAELQEAGRRLKTVTARFETWATSQPDRAVPMVTSEASTEMPDHRAFLIPCSVPERSVILWDIYEAGSFPVHYHTELKTFYALTGQLDIWYINKEENGVILDEHYITQMGPHTIPWVVPAYQKHRFVVSVPSMILAVHETPKPQGAISEVNR